MRYVMVVEMDVPEDAPEEHLLAFMKALGASPYRNGYKVTATVAETADRVLGALSW